MGHWQQISIAIDVAIDDGKRGMAFRDNFFYLIISIGCLLTRNVPFMLHKTSRLFMSSALHANPSGENMSIPS